jgi:hypothetical protein
MTKLTATQNATAFRTYAELTSECAKGYVPTLMVTKGRAKCIQAENAAVVELRSYLVADGYRVWPEQI